MKKVFLSILLLQLVHLSFATTYYLSNTGNDTNSGTSPAEAWQTITQLSSIVLQAGDSILFACGGIFRGEIVVTSSGTFTDPIYFGKYGEGNLPIISGAQSITNWTVFSDTIYHSPLSQQAKQLFVNGKRMTVARHPNHGFFIEQGGISNNGFIDSLLGQPDNFWKNALVHIRTSDKLWEINQVDSSTATEIFCASPFANFLLPNYGYYFDNQLVLLDTAGEWIYEPITQNIYLCAPDGNDPTGLNVEASTYYHGISMIDTIEF